MALLAGQSPQQYYDSGNYGDYQFISLTDVINNFMAAYVGDDKILGKTHRTDVSFHAHRALAELHYDTFRSCKSQEITVPASLTMILPQDYVNYTKISWSDSSGIKHRIYPTLCNTSNPTNPFQNSDGDFKVTVDYGGIVNGVTSFPLDKWYDNIVPGMIMTSPSVAAIPNPITITGTLYSSAAVTINGVVFPAGTMFIQVPAGSLGISANVPLEFSNPDGSLVTGNTSIAIGDGVTNVASWAGNSDVITFTSAASLAGLEVGMVVSHTTDFPAGTVITAIDPNNLTVIVSNLSTSASVLFERIAFTKLSSESDTWTNYSSTTPSGNTDDYEDDTFWPMAGERYGLDPQHAQANGSFFIDCPSGKIHFSSNMSGKTVVLDYISDGLGTDAEMLVPKLAEEAIYKWIAYGCLSTRANVPGNVLGRFKKEKFSETRKAKIRISNIKIEEITQILRGKSKQIKH